MRGSLAVTVTDPPPAAAAAATAVGATPKVQALTTFCTTGITVPPTVIVAFLTAPLVFAAASTASACEPVPVAAPRVSHDCDDDAVQSQNSLLAVMASCPADAAPPSERAPGRTV